MSQHQEPLPEATDLEALAAYAVFGDDASSAAHARVLLAQRQMPITTESAFALSVQFGKLSPHENLLLLQRRWPQGFDSHVEQHADKLARHTVDLSTRTDVTEEAAYSIDSPDTIEVDDAISFVGRHPAGGWKLAVHIADPDAYVPLGDLLDQEAARRGTTLYLPQERFLMFPQILAAEAMSLLVGVPRPALSIFFHVTPEGNIAGRSIRLSAVRVSRRFSYEEAEEELYRGSHDGDQLAAMLEATEALRLRREEEGAVVEDRAEYTPVLLPNGGVQCKKTERNSPTRELVTELMIAANVVVASFFRQKQIAAIYRAQRWKPGAPSRPQEPLAWLEKVELTSTPQSHAGLGVSAYLQMTSPIRRYTDLLLQRQLKAALQQQPLPYTAETLETLAKQNETQRQTAAQIEQWSRQYWLLQALQQKSQTQHDAIVLRRLHEKTYLIELAEYGLRTTLESPRVLRRYENIYVHCEQCLPRELTLVASLRSQ